MINASKEKYPKLKFPHPKMLQKATLFMLWLINKKEMHGYEIIKTLKKEGGPHPGANRIYPLLNLMLEQKLILQKEKKNGQRIRKIYVLTNNGKEMLKNGKKVFTGLIKEFLKDMIA
ncbi:MAG: PadR family transcriptional regulator [Candidatus Micrarchaeota archaeon]|nr:PadR family transcriptional regulator [Candidatus Micrarchaeota archaeon]